MNEKILLWLWLQSCLGFENNRIIKILETFGGPENIYETNEHFLTYNGLFTPKEAEKLKNKRLDYAKKIYLDCQALEYEIVAMNDEKYPKRLLTIKSPPLVLYISGSLPNEKKLHTAIVGKRRGSEWGRKLSFQFSYELSKSDAVIVSGGAMGIDTQAHKGALQAGRPTIAVLGCGINVDYLHCNKELRSEIKQHGALVSEYPPGYTIQNASFQKRNRIISGISHCTFVVEAGKKSGSFITANYAKEQHRMIFVVPHNDKMINYGSDTLSGQGAAIVKRHEDILDWYQEHKNDLDQSLCGRYRFGKSKEAELPLSNGLVCYPYDDRIMFVMGENEKEETIPLNDESFGEAIDPPEQNSDTNTEMSELQNFFDHIKYENTDSVSQNIDDEEFRKKYLAYMRQIGAVRQWNPSRYDFAEENDSDKQTLKKEPIKKENVTLPVEETLQKFDQTKQKNTVETQKNSIKSENELKSMLTENAFMVYHTISDKPVHVDEICAASGKNIREVNMALSELEMTGCIQSVSGRRYIRK